MHPLPALTETSHASVDGASSPAAPPPRAMAAVEEGLPGDAERDLVARCVAGDAPAHRDLFARHHAQVRTVCARLGARPPLEDVVQEVFCAVFRSLPRFRGESSLATWISRIAVRTALIHVRKRRLRERVESGEPPRFEVVHGTQPSLERQALEREAMGRLRSALHALPPKQREALTRHVLEGLSLEETAIAMQCSLVAVKASVWRARHELRRCAAQDPSLAGYVGQAECPEDWL